MSLVGALQSSFELSDDDVFESTHYTPHDEIATPTSRDAMHLEGSGLNGGLVEYLHVDEHDGKFYHEMKQDIEPYLKRAHDICSGRGKDAGKNKGKDMYLAASVPPVVLHAWLNSKGLKMYDFKGSVVKDFLNDTINKPYRIWQGSV